LTFTDFISCFSVVIYFSTIIQGISATNLSIKPHRLRDQDEQIPSKRQPFHIYVGWRCFLLGHNSREDKEMQTFWWKLGEFFGDYLCMDRLNNEDINKVNAAAIGNAQPLTDTVIFSILNRAQKAAALHYTAGLGMLAETYHRLGKYFHKRLCAARGVTEIIEDSLYVSNPHCHGKPSKAGIITHQDLPIDSPEYQDYRIMRNFCYIQALQYLTAAIELKDDCEDITYNATTSNNMSVACSWWHKNQNSLDGMQDYFKKLLRCSNLFEQIRPAMNNGRTLASDMIRSASPFIDQAGITPASTSSLSPT
jgi:hypothetical protein